MNRPKRVSEPRQFAELDYQRAVRGEPVRSARRPGRQPEQGPVSMECDLHLSFDAPGERRGREQMLKLQEALLKLGYSVTMTGDRVVPVTEPGPRRLQ